MQIVTLSSKRQITLSKSLLDSLDVKPKDKLLVEKDRKTIRIKPMRESVVDELGGSLKKYVHPSKLGIPWKKVKEEMGKAIAEHVASEGLK